MLFPSVGGYMLKNTEAIICFILFSNQFSDNSYGSYMIEVEKHRCLRTLMFSKFLVKSIDV